ncbi:MAG: LemA family protein [Gammaproteobacteria bacterium]
MLSEQIYHILYIGLGIGFIFYVISLYNNLIELKNSVNKNLSNIDVLLKQRNSELPKLVESCKQYMAFEKDTLEKVILARNTQTTAIDQKDINQINASETMLRANLGKLFALAENYPDLKTNESFLQLQGRISHLEESISDRREFYNESVNLHNIAIAKFPDVIVARLFNFQPLNLLVFSKEETADVDVKSLFRS